jgi:hypothetical protein
VYAAKFLLTRPLYLARMWAMEVRLFPNSTRPGVGLRPRREGQRPHLPQHARHCPVLEAGSALGYLIYPPLEPYEAFHIEYLGDGRYQFMFYVAGLNKQLEPVFSLTLSFPVGSIGKAKEEITFASKKPPMSREAASTLARCFINTEDTGTPQGGIALRGSMNFQTPQGWDTVYAPIFNMIERPIAPMLVVRVETDWYPHQTEFRYVLQQGEGISGEHSIPIGQVFFVPREEITMRDVTPEEFAAICKSAEEYLIEKAKTKQTTNYGLQYSPLYTRRSRQTR